MAHHLPRPLYAVAALVLVLAGVSAQPPSNPKPDDKTLPKLPEPPAPAKELSPQEIDDVMERAFGAKSAEVKRPVRLWIQVNRLAIAAEKAIVSRDGETVEFLSASVRFMKEDDGAVLRGDKISIRVPVRLESAADLQSSSVAEIQLPSKDGLITIAPMADLNGPPTIIGGGTLGKGANVKPESPQATPFQF